MTVYKFKVNDRVQHVYHGLGTVLYADGDSLGVRFDKRKPEFHDLAGLCEYGHGYYVSYAYTQRYYQPYDPDQENEDDCL